MAKIFLLIKNWLLLPIFDKPIYNLHPANNDQTLGKFATDSFEIYFQFTTNHWQSDDNQALFQQILNFIPAYHVTVDCLNDLLNQKSCTASKITGTFQKYYQTFFNTN